MCNAFLAPCSQGGIPHFPQKLSGVYAGPMDGVVNEVTTDQQRPQGNYYIAYPNPFRQHTNIEYCLMKDDIVNLRVLNSNGVFIRELLSNKEQKAGTYKVGFDTNTLATGTYMYELTIGEKRLNGKLIKVR